MADRDRDRHDSTHAAETRITETREESASTSVTLRRNGLPDDARMYIARSDAARAVGKSVKQLTDNYEENPLTPVKNHKGQVFYLLDEFEQFVARVQPDHAEHREQRSVKRTIETRAVQAPYPPELAAEAFVFFRTRKSAADLVIERQIDPRIAEQLFDDFGRCSGGMALDGRELESVRRAVFDLLPGEPIVVNTAAELIKHLYEVSRKVFTEKEHKAELECRRCMSRGHQPARATHCDDCVREMRGNSSEEGWARGKAGRTKPTQ